MEAESDINFEPERVLLFDCPLCKFFTTYFSRLSEHAIGHPERDIEFVVYKCSECELLCSSEYLLQEHSEVHHPDKTVVIQKVEELFLNCRTDSDNGDDEEQQQKQEEADNDEEEAATGADGTDYSRDEEFSTKWTTNAGSVGGGKRAWASEKNTNNQQMKHQQQQFSRKRQFGAAGQSSAVSLMQPGFNRRPIGGPMQPVHLMQKRLRPNWSQGQGVRQQQFGGVMQPDLVVRDKGDYVISVSRGGLEARLRFDPAFYSSEAASQTFNTLATELAWEQLKTRPKPGGKGESTEPRMTYWVGPKYSYGSVHLPENSNWHPALMQIKQDVERALEGKVTFNACLAILYRDHNDSMPWHSDNEREMGSNPAIASVSFGASRLFELRRFDVAQQGFGGGGGGGIGGVVFGQQIQGFRSVHVPLSAGSLLYTCGSIQKDWQHRIGRQSASCGPRINLTFRTIVTGSGGSKRTGK
ncbi:hypothetical protein BOX15_Mlig015948g2 [Macrostomum lignano]|uniref:Fe2OG dioxygenase domain-containing protein n=1 Tax=Macrostomum lignano TaxID=282301 RepID=A0A267FMZ1_9PLAT|nr:hypothetical protein BOX15_Mlig015948g2 [Macrostomum lignano]